MRTRAKRVSAETGFYSNSLFQRVFAILVDSIKSQNATAWTTEAVRQEATARLSEAARAFSRKADRLFDWENALKQ
jgi:hypothetical protein